MRFPRLAVVLSWALVPLIVIGFVPAQTIGSRPGPDSNVMGMGFHMIGTSAFAALLFVLAIISAHVITGKSGLAHRGYVPTQIIALAFAAVWLICILAGDGTQAFEILVAVPLLVAMILALVFASGTKTAVPATVPTR